MRKLLVLLLLGALSINAQTMQNRGYLTSPIETNSFTVFGDNDLQFGFEFRDIMESGLYYTVGVESFYAVDKKFLFNMQGSFGYLKQFDKTMVYGGGRLGFVRDDLKDQRRPSIGLEVGVDQYVYKGLFIGVRGTREYFLRSVEMTGQQQTKVYLRIGFNFK